MALVRVRGATYRIVEEHVCLVVQILKPRSIVGELVIRIGAGCVPEKDASDLAFVVFRHLGIAMNFSQHT